MAPPSKLRPHREAIAEALDAGTSVNNLALTYGCHLATMQEFIGRWLPERATAGNARRAGDRHDPLQRTQYKTLWDSRRQSDLSRQRAEEF